MSDAQEIRKIINLMESSSVNEFWQPKSKLSTWAAKMKTPFDKVAQAGIQKLSDTANAEYMSWRKFLASMGKNSRNGTYQDLYNFLKSSGYPDKFIKTSIQNFYKENPSASDIKDTVLNDSRENAKFFWKITKDIARNSPGSREQSALGARASSIPKYQPRQQAQQPQQQQPVVHPGGQQQQLSIPQILQMLHAIEQQLQQYQRAP